MNFVWLVVVFLTNFSRSIGNENAADLFRNGVLYPKNENLVLQGSIDVNGSLSSSGPTHLHSKLHQESSAEDLPNGGSQLVQPTGIQPKLLDTEEEFQAGLLWRSQSEMGLRELNSSLSWWWIKRQQHHLVNGRQQQYKLRWGHRRWRQQPPPPLNHQQYYRWRHQQPVMNSHLQNVVDERRQNLINQGNGDRILNQSQQNQKGDLSSVVQQDKVNSSESMRTPNGMVDRDGQLAQNKQQNSVLVDNQSIQSLGNTFAGKTQNQASNQLNIRNANSAKRNKVLHLSNVRNYHENPRKLLDSRQQKLEQGEQKFDLSSSQLPSTKFQPPVVPQISMRNQSEQQQLKTSSLSPSEAEEESESNSESYRRSKELYPIKPPLSGFGIFPVINTHAVKGENVLLKRHGSVKPLVQSGLQSRSDKQFQTLYNSNIQQETWVFGLNLRYKKISRKNNKIGFLDQPKSISQPTSTYQQTNSILQGKEKQPTKLSEINNEPLDQKKFTWESNATVSNLSNFPRDLNIPMIPQEKKNEKLNGNENHQNDVTKINQKVNNINLKNAALVGRDTKSYGSSSTPSYINAYAGIPQKNTRQLPSSYQKKVQVNDKFSEKSLQSGSPGLPQIPPSLVPNITENRNLQESAQYQKMLINPPSNSTESLSEDFHSTSEPPLTVEPEFYTTDISAQTDEPSTHKYESNTGVRSKDPEEYDKIGQKFTNETHSNFQGHPAGVKFKPSESSKTSNMEFGETDKSHPSIFPSHSTFGVVNYNWNASTNPLHTVLKKYRKEEKKISNDNNYSNLQLAQKELVSSYANSNHTTLNQSTFTDVKRKHQIFRSSYGTNIVRNLKKRTIDSRGNSPKETDNQRLSNMESFGGPINIDPYDISLQNTDPSKSSVDMELSSNEVEYLFQVISSGMRLLMNKIMGITR